MVNPFEILNSPQMIHAVAVHFPIALGILGIPLVFLCAVTQMKNVTLRWLTFACYALMAAVAFVTVITGEHALSAVPSAVWSEVRTLAEQHQFFAENVWVFATVTALLVMLGGFKNDRLRMTFTVLAVLASVGTGVWVGVTGDLGGTLVYTHGVGTPGMMRPGRVNPIPNAPGQTSESAGNVPSSNTLSPSPSSAASAPISAGHESYMESIVSFWRGVVKRFWPG